jgi:NADH-quinone oxidoreductase subunit H
LPILGLVYFLIKAFAVYIVTQWIKGTFPRVRIDQMMAFAWKILVPLILGLILWQMLAMKLPGGPWIQYIAVFAGNILVVAFVLRILGRYFAHEEIRTKRAFEPRSLIGVMQPAPSGD